MNEYDSVAGCRVSPLNLKFPLFMSGKFYINFVKVIMFTKLLIYKIIVTVYWISPIKPAHHNVKQVQNTSNLVVGEKRTVYYKIY